jgi:chorismate mutase
MAIRGIRGATVTSVDTADEILASTQGLLSAVLQANPSLQVEDLCSAIFTLTEDLSAAYPAEAARQLGWNSVPLLCTRDVPVPGSLPRCIRVLLHWNTNLSQESIHHVYLGQAAQLRPDLANNQGEI